VQLPGEVADLFLLYLEQRLWEVWGAGRPRLVAACQELESPLEQIKYLALMACPH
jgi:hypothetical protein